MKNTMITGRGKSINYRAPDPAEFDIADIATALSRECRFAGHADAFYSVAQHSVLVSRHVAAGFEMEALLHDATEAYLKDIPTPLKSLLPCYLELESKFDAAIRQRFALPPPSEEVHLADGVMLMAEMRDFFPSGAAQNAQVLADYVARGMAPKKIWALPADMAREQFLLRFQQLNKERGGVCA